MLALVVCVPVPALALSGLNVPLPSVVERVAAALVPFATAATIEDGTTLASGRIVQAPGQDARVGRSSAPKPVATVRVVRRVAAPTPQSSSRARTKAGTLLPVSSGPSPTFGEDSTAATPASPAPSPATTEDTTPAPTESPAPAPSANVDEKPKPKPKPRPTDPRTPVAPNVEHDPGRVADVDSPVEPDVKPVDDVVDADPGVKPVVPLLPPIRERDESPLPSGADSGK